MTKVEACQRSCAPGSRRIPAEVWDATVEAQRRLEAAAREARDLVEAARAEADAIRLQAAAEGREQGVAGATMLVARAALARDALLASSEAQLVQLAFEVAQRVLERVADRDREAVVEIAARGLETVRRRARVALRAHPADMAALREAEPRLLGQLSQARCISFVEDATVGRAGVVVETEAGTVDARLETQIEALRRAVETSGRGWESVPCAHPEDEVSRSAASVQGTPGR